MDTPKPRRITSALLASWIGKGCLLEGELIKEHWNDEGGITRTVVLDERPEQELLLHACILWTKSSRTHDDLTIHDDYTTPNQSLREIDRSSVGVYSQHLGTGMELFYRRSRAWHKLRENSSELFIDSLFSEDEFATVTTSNFSSIHLDRIHAGSHTDEERVCSFTLRQRIFVGRDDAEPHYPRSDSHLAGFLQSRSSFSKFLKSQARRRRSRARVSSAVTSVGAYNISSGRANTPRPPAATAGIAQC
ncbi:hypothetical protein EVAR_11549_1 [Eumeta japonica]|uniref:Uncharacterized protein n=1 Tax=Eumeta variegata TaxID=151549 RepID=A0A4C1U050_EUMVA|nr:hypothetical protein EVAR_11549_1 [Eumeta japonica]